MVPTHIKSHILDLLFININCYIHNTHYNQSVIFYEHVIVLLVIKCSRNKHKRPTTYLCKYSTNNFKGLNECILNVDLSTCFNSGDIDSKLIITYACSIYIPNVRFRLFQQPKWFTSMTRLHLRYIRFIRRKVKRPFYTWVALVRFRVHSVEWALVINLLGVP